MHKNIFKEITKKHSTTFYYSTLLFPKAVREDIFALYAFLRTADDIVDEERKKEKFIEFKKNVYGAIYKKETSKDTIVSSFTNLYFKYAFTKDYLDSFFDSLELDFKQPLVFKDNEFLQKYVYGVAGVVGLMMAKLLKLPDDLFHSAREFGEIMQMINIIRDVKEDYFKNRVYLPQEDLRAFGLRFGSKYNKAQKHAFEKLIRFEIEKALLALDSLSGPLSRIPHPYQKPITISRDVYRTVAEKIRRHPLDVWEKKVRVSKVEILLIILKNYMNRL